MPWLLESKLVTFPTGFGKVLGSTWPEILRDKLLESRGLEPIWEVEEAEMVEVSVKINRKHAVCVQTMRIENTVNPNFRRKPAGLCLQNERWPLRLWQFWEGMTNDRMDGIITLFFSDTSECCWLMVNNTLMAIIITLAMDVFSGGATRVWQLAASIRVDDGYIYIYNYS